MSRKLYIYHKIENYILFSDPSLQTTTLFEDDNAPVHRASIIEEYKHANDTRGVRRQMKKTQCLAIKHYLL